MEEKKGLEHLPFSQGGTAIMPSSSENASSEFAPAMFDVEQEARSKVRKAILIVFSTFFAGMMAGVLIGAFLL